MAASAAPISVPSSMRPVSSMVTWAWMRHLAGRRRPWPGGQPIMAAFIAEEVEVGLDEEQVDAALEQAGGLDLVGVAQLGEADLAEATANLVPGPIEPATKRGRSGVEKSSATSRAMRASARVISWDRSAMPYSPSGMASAPKVFGLDDVGADLEVRGVQLGDDVGPGDDEVSRCSPRGPGRRSRRR